MIDKYLKTGMVFYRDREEQHFRQECCKETFCQFTDNAHFPSFQIYTPLEVTIDLGFAIYDLEDKLIISPQGIALDYFHHVGAGTTVSHDFRDAIAYHASIQYGTCYYAILGLYDPNGSRYEYWYSEVFKICDCDVIGAGDEINLIENGEFEDWDLAANPNNTPDGWTVNNRNATNYVDNSRPPPAGQAQCQLISDNTQVLNISQTIVTIGEWYVWTIKVVAVAAGGIAIWNGAVLDTLLAIGSYTGVFQAAHIDFRVYRSGVCDVTFTALKVEEFVGFAFCDMMTLNWWSDCDWDDIIYQDGYRNSLVLGDAQGKIALDSPKEEITGNAPSERLGDKKFSDIVIKKHFRFNIRIPEYLWNALIRLPAYGSNMPNFHCWITMPIHLEQDGIGAPIPITDTEVANIAPMAEVDVLGEWDTGNCFNTFTIEFIDDEYPVAATNCCDNEDVSEV